MENSIIKAKIKCEFSKVFSVILYVILILAVVWILPFKSDWQNIACNLFDIQLYIPRWGLRGILAPLVVGVIIIVLSIFVIALKLYTQDAAKECSIELTSEGINGRRKRIGAKAGLRLPIEKIDSIFVTETVFDKIRGGKTLGIRSNTGVIKFVCVQNADEFVTAANKAIEENKKANRTAPVAPAPVVQATSNADELKKYKDLLDIGVITQEEFEAKKKQILGL